MNNYNSFHRLSNIFTLFFTDGENASIEQISQTLSVPIDTIRNDIYEVFQHELFRPCLDDEFFDENDQLSLSDTEPFSLQKGEFFFSQNSIPIYVTHNEKELLTKYYPELIDFNKQQPYMIKESPIRANYRLDDLCEQIQEAIDLKHYIKFNYKNTKNNTLKTYELIPRLIYHNINNGRIYMITLYDEKISSWRLDNMRDVVSLHTRTDTTSISDALLQRFDYMWGMDNSSNESPVHVKLRIEAYNRNLLEKIKNDTSRRKHAQLYQDDDYWYYEDDIIGLSAFRSWVYQFGYSVVVLEPQSLAREVYDSAVERLEKYKKISGTHSN